MISYIYGKLIEKKPAGIVIEAGGLGYDVAVSFATFGRLGDIGKLTKILVYQHVRQDALLLYGFLDRDEKKLFLMLIGISGIGPKLALGILSSVDINEFSTAVKNSNIGYLTSISGVGKKTAQRIVLELKDKLILQTSQAQDGRAASHIRAHHIEDDAIGALTALGYTYQSARAEINKVLSSAPDIKGVEELVRKVLKK